MLLDEPNEYFADPFGVAITPDGKKAFISHSGVDRISVVNIDSLRKIINEHSTEELEFYSNHLGVSRRFVEKRIKTGANPKGIVVSPDGKRLYVAEHLQDRIAVISTETLETINTIDLGGPRRVTVARQGRRLLNNADGTFQTQFTYIPATLMVMRMVLCTIWPRKTWAATGEHPIAQGYRRPYKWNGKNHTIYKQDGLRFPLC